MTETAPLLELLGLTKHFADAQGAAVSKLDLALAPGELLALLGPSGCGKTTSLRMIGGFETPDSGTIRLNGREITALPPEKRGIGFVFQDYALFPHLSVLENVAFGLNRRPRNEAEARAAEMLALVGLADMAARRPDQLSGGQQQRVALARSLAVAPPLILLDEPFSNLDARMRQDTRQEVRRVLKASGAAGILVTHDQEEALAMADRIAVMEAGRIVQIGTPEEIYRRPASAFIAAFIGRANLLTGVAEGLVVQTAVGPLKLESPASGIVTLAIRPEEIDLTPDPAGAALLLSREFRGHDQLCFLEQAGTRLVALAPANAGFAPGTRMRIALPERVVPLS